MTSFLVICLNPTFQKTFRVDRLDHGQVNRVRSHRLDLAGKGVSTTRILTQLGESVVHLTQAGGEHLSTFERLCREDRIDVEIVLAPIEIRTCYTLLDATDRSTTEIVEPGAEVPPDLEPHVLGAYDRLLDRAHTVIISGSKAPGFTPRLYPEMVRRAAAAGRRVILDIRGDDLIASLPYGPSLVKINVNEFSATFLPETLPEERPPDSFPSALSERMLELARGGCEVVLTNGREPVMFVEGSKVSMIAPQRVEPVNAIGSGDAVTAGIAAGLRRGMPLRGAIALGLDCARRNVMLEKPGTIE